MATIACEYKPLQVEAVEVTASNYRQICDFVDGHRPRMADNPTLPRGKYFGIFVETRYGRQLARIGDYIVKVGDREYRAFCREEFTNTFNLIERKQL
jgi:hypothetical protein